MLSATIHRMYECGLLKTCKPDHTINSYTYEYMGRLVKQRVTVNPVLKKTDLKNIAKQAVEGNMSAMFEIAHMYSVGYGLPYDTDLAEKWISFGMVHGKADGYTACCTALLAHVKDNPSHILPPSLYTPCMDAIARIDDIGHGEFVANCFATPQVAGVPVYLIYRHTPGNTPQLYAGFYKSPRSMFLNTEKLIELGAPSRFATPTAVPNALEYEPFGVNTMYIVRGYIYTPVSQGDADNYAALDLFVMDKTITKTRADFDVKVDTTEYDELEKTVNRTQKIRERIANAGKSTQAYDKPLRDAERALASLKATMDAVDPQQHYEDYMTTRPIYKLRMALTDVYRWHRNTLHYVALEVIDNTTAQLKDYPAIKLTGVVPKTDDPKKTVNRLQRVLDARITQLNIAPSDVQTTSTGVKRIDA